MSKKIITIELTSNNGYIIDSQNLECNNTGPVVSVSVNDTITIVSTLLKEEFKTKS